MIENIPDLPENKLPKGIQELFDEYCSKPIATIHNCPDTIEKVFFFFAEKIVSLQNQLKKELK